MSAMSQPSIREYLRALVAMQSAQLEYLHVIAWDAALRRSSDRDRAVVERTATRIAATLFEGCPEVLAELAKPVKP